jgi:hypothetical protein
MKLPASVGQAITDPYQRISLVFVTFVSDVSLRGVIVAIIDITRFLELSVKLSSNKPRTGMTVT